MKCKVAIVRCGSYNTEEVSKAVSRGLELMGGAESFVKQGEKILLKVNLLVGEVPEKCVTTHPAVFRAVAEMFAAKGAIVQYGDSPGFGTPLAAAKKSGIADVAKELKIEEADFKEGREVFFEQGNQNKSFYIGHSSSQPFLGVAKANAQRTQCLPFLGGVCIPPQHWQVPSFNHL